MERLVAGARGAIESGRFAGYSTAVLGGAVPWAV
jgi:hypothetical protein